jgi:hypothetical protein
VRKIERIIILMFSVLLLAAAAGATWLGNGSLAAATTDWGTKSEPLIEATHVHGRWTVDVISVSGNLIDQREFSNDLTETGETILARMLTGGFAPNSWAIRLPIDGGDAVTSELFTAEPTDDGRGVVLMAEIAMRGDTELTRFETHVVEDGFEVSDDSTFTATKIGPVQVFAGQTIRVTVAITFD